MGLYLFDANNRKVLEHYSEKDGLQADRFSIFANSALKSQEGALWFSGLSNEYAYFLEGFETQWNRTETRRYGKYTNLPGGTYTLRLFGSNNYHL
jgi:hypothetical protein